MNTKNLKDITHYCEYINFKSANHIWYSTNTLFFSDSRSGPYHRIRYRSRFKKNVKFNYLVFINNNNYKNIREASRFKIKYSGKRNIYNMSNTYDDYLFYKGEFL